MHESHCASSNISIITAWSKLSELPEHPRLKQPHVFAILEKLNRSLASAQRRHVIDIKECYSSFSRATIDRLLEKLQPT